MSSTINASTASGGGVVTTADASGILQLQTAGVTGLTIDASQNVGIGTSSPSYKLDITGDARVNASVGQASIWFSQAGVVNGRINAGGGGGTDVLVYANRYVQIVPTDSLIISTGITPTERMRIDSSGNVTLQENISVGGAAPTTSGSGITFPATQAASTDANTLDDYEEGTWTPVLTFTTTGTMTYTTSTAIGNYTKIGNVVTCRIALALSAFTIGTASGQARISLPFTSAQNYFSASVYGSAFTTTYPTLAHSAATVGYVNLFGNTAINTAPTAVTAANFSTTSTMLFSITYTV